MRRLTCVAGATLVDDTLYTYDEASQLINRQDRDSSSSSYANTTFVFDDASRLTDRIENGVSITFGYDATHQVTSDDGTGYSYDGTGNRTNAGYSTGAANRLVSDGTWTWTYDAAGNATARTNGTATWTYSYDGRGQMIGAQESSTGKRVAFIYDASGNKVERQAFK
jgi:YD repeat-containing protein